MENREMICIGCPLGCSMMIGIDGDQIQVSGNTCKRGEVYARKEILNPTRIVTSSVHVTEGVMEMVSVKTKEDIPKDRIFACMEEIKNTVIPAPIEIGDIIIKDIAGTGISLVATKRVERKQEIATECDRSSK